MDEIQLQTIPPLVGVTAYAVLFNAALQAYNTASMAFEAYAVGNVSDYDVALTEGATPGFYSADFPDTIPAGRYTVTIYQRAGGTPASTDNVIGFGIVDWLDTDDDSTGTCLASLTYVKLQNNISVDTYDAVLTNQIGAACSVVRNYCRQDFTPTAYDEYYDIDQYLYQLLLRHYPIIGVNTVTLYPYDSTLTETIAGSQFISSTYGAIQPKPNSTARYCGGFPIGFQSVKVNYTAGYSTIPNDVKEAVAKIVKRMFEGYRSKLSGLYDSEKLGDYNYKLRADALASLSDDIKAQLAPYRVNTL